MFTKFRTLVCQVFLFVCLSFMGAFSWANDDREWVSLKELAQRVESDGKELYRAARDSIKGRGTPREIAALDELRKFVLEAKRYLHAVEVLTFDVNDTYRDFKKLKEAYKNAEEKFIYVMAFRHLRDDLHTIGTFLDEIQDKYKRDDDPFEDLPELAHRISDLAEDIHHRAERAVRRPNFWQRRALQALHELSNEAKHFHQQVEENASHKSHTEIDYQKLKQSYNRAEQRYYLDLSKVVPLLEEDIEQLRELIEEAGRCYEETPRRHRDHRDDDHFYPRPRNS